MFIALRDGQLNETIDKVLGPSNAVPESKASRPPGKRRSKPPPTLPNVPAGQPGTLSPQPEEAAAPSPPLAKRAAPTLTDLVLADLETARARPGPASTRTPAKGIPAQGAPAVPPRPAAPAGRYAPARPAAIFTAPPDPGSIFGGSSISEQSLDEVILSYLAEDLDGTSDD